jgi:inositol-phosphate transport system substrate-binding protein
MLLVLSLACTTTPMQQPAAPGKAPDAAQPAAPTAPAGQPAASTPSATATPVVEARSSGPVFASEVVKITAWTIGPDAPSFYRRDNLISAAETLNRKLEQEGSNKRVQVEATFESGGQWSDFKQKFVLAAEARQAPDIILGGHEDLAPWSAAGYVIPLDDLIKKYSENFQDIFPTIWPAMKLNGITYQIPQDMEARPMYYRKDLLARLGWPREKIDGLPQAIRNGEFIWSDLVATAKEAIENKVIEPGNGWWHRTTRGHDHYIFYYQNGGQMQDPDTGKLVIVKDALEKHFQLHYDAVKTHKITRENHIGSQSREWHENTAVGGKVLFFNGGTWMWAEWLKFYKVPETDLFENVGYALIPAAERGGKPVTLSHPVGYMVTSSSKNQELAFRLIAEATTPELHSRHSVESAHSAVLKTQLDDPTYQKDRFLLDTTYMAEFTHFIPNHAQYGVYDEVLFRLLSAVEAGQLQPKEAAEVAVDELKAQLRDELVIK